MAEHREPVRLVLTDNFSGRLAAATRAAHEMSFRMELDAATWEPHDWDRF